MHDLKTVQQADPKTYLAIEGLRGILAVIVCLGHFGLGTLLSPWGLAFNIHFAVDLFFVISGLVLAHSNYYTVKPINGYQFAVKRFARLYPLHLLTLLVMCLLHWLQSQPISLRAFLENLFLSQNIGLSPFDRTLNFPSWSISVEFWCTLLLFYVANKGLSRKYMAATAILFIICLSLFFPKVLMEGGYEGQIGGFLNTGLLRGLAGTLLGILIYLSLQNPLVKRCFNSTVIPCLSALGLSLFFFLIPPVSSALGFYLFCFFLVGSLATHLTFGGLLSSRLFVGLGAISYSIYLLHIPLYLTLQFALGDAAVKGVVGKLILLPTLFVLSWVTYRWFEQPLQRIVRGFLLGSFSKRKLKSFISLASH